MGKAKIIALSNRDRCTLRLKEFIDEQFKDSIAYKNRYRDWSSNNYYEERLKIENIALKIETLVNLLPDKIVNSLLSKEMDKVNNLRVTANFCKGRFILYIKDYTFNPLMDIIIEENTNSVIIYNYDLYNGTWVVNDITQLYNKYIKPYFVRCFCS